MPVMKKQKSAGLKFNLIGQLLPLPGDSYSYACARVKAMNFRGVETKASLSCLMDDLTSLYETLHGYRRINLIQS